MSDPLHALRAPVTPAEPDPAFAGRLRARLERALQLPEGVAVSHATTQTHRKDTATPREAASAAPEHGGSTPVHGGAVPYLAVREARRAIEWYGRVLAAELREEPVVMPDGRVGHAELALGDGVLYLADEHPELGVRAPDPAGVPVSLVLAVPDLDATIAAATGAGARLDRDPYQAYGYRNATVTDPFGHRWMLQEPLTEAAPRVAAPARGRHGDIGYTSLWVPDAERAAAFYQAVLGWEYEPGHDPRGRLVTGTALSQGLWGGQARSTLFCSYVVDDAVAAAARVRSAGGHAGEPVGQPYGLSVDCADNQGMRFAVYQASAPGPERHQGEHAGTVGLSYVTLEVPDADRAREFYAAVLGWRLEQGRVTGWQTVGTAPPIGISGRHEPPTAVPVWLVSDVVAAAGRVRAAGGAAPAPHREPYGLIAECTDDQGTRFSLVERPE